LGVDGIVSPLINKAFFWGKFRIPFYTPMGFSALFNCVYINRNIPFEPRRTFDNNVVENALYKVKHLLEGGYPAVITSHRANYTDFLNSNGYFRCFDLLKQLILGIHNLFPDTIFLSSSQFLEEVSKAK
jgi:hypothetical protein